jgi:hypothetical protein
MEEPSTYPELDEALAEIGDPEAAESSGMFRIDSLDVANWAVRRIAVHAAKLGEAEAFAQRERDRIELWLLGERERAEQSTAFLAGLLRQYHEARLAENGVDVRTVDRDGWEKARDKTIRLPAGELVARRGEARWEMDEAVLIPYLRQHARELIRNPDPQIDKRAVKAALQDRVTEDGFAVNGEGEPIPGIRVHEPEVSFKVRPR